MLTIEAIPLPLQEPPQIENPRVEVNNTKNRLQRMEATKQQFFVHFYELQSNHALPKFHSLVFNPRITIPKSKN